MKEDSPLDETSVRWPAIAALCSILCILTIFAVTYRSSARAHRIPPSAAARAFEAANDLPVLQAALAQSCAATNYSVLASKPDEPAGSRSVDAPSQLPAGLECPGVRVVDSTELDELFSKADPMEADPTPPGWDRFHRRYPGASGIIHISLPAYTSASSAVVRFGVTSRLKFGTGWELDLVKVHGKWVITNRRPSWIA